MQQKELSTADAQRFLRNVGAEPIRADGATKVYVSRRLDVTITQFPTNRPGVVKLQVVKGCTC